MKTYNKSFTEANQQASAKNEAIGGGEIEKHDDINPKRAFEDINKMQSTDDM